MNDKRKYQRVRCNFKAKFRYYEGDPGNSDLTNNKPKKGKGIILDISQGGIFLVSNERVGINAPAEVSFRTKHNKYDLSGKVVRTGMLKNNPSEAARRFANITVKGDYYIAIEFNTPVHDLIAEGCE